MLPYQLEMTLCSNELREPVLFRQLTAVPLGRGGLSGTAVASARTSRRVWLHYSVAMRSGLGRSD